MMLPPNSLERYKGHIKQKKRKKLTMRADWQSQTQVFANYSQALTGTLPPEVTISNWKLLPQKVKRLVSVMSGVNWLTGNPSELLSHLLHTNWVDCSCNLPSRCFTSKSTFQPVIFILVWFDMSTMRHQRTSLSSILPTEVSLRNTLHLSRTNS